MQETKYMPATWAMSSTTMRTDDVELNESKIFDTRCSRVA